MRFTSIARWLLVAVFLAGCTGAVEPPAAATSAETLTARVAISTAAPATAAPAAQPQPAATPTIAPAVNGGGMTNDEPALPAATVAAANTQAPSPAVGASGTPAATTAPIVIAPAPTATATAAIWSTDPHPLQIEVMRQQSYPGSSITVEQTLEPGSNYSRYVVTYLSDGYKIYALMTVPDGTGPTGAKPTTGWPVIIFNHGYIPPTEYRTTERYVAYVDAIARSGYIVFKSDYRGWGSSEGGNVAGGGYGTPELTVDVLNAVASLRAYPDADPNRVGMWGHSLGGQLTLRAMVVSQDIRAGVIWGGVVPPYSDIIARWDFMDRAATTPQTPRPTQPANYAVAWVRDFSNWAQDFRNKYGAPEQNPDFWATISPNTYLADLSGPIALHHSTTDEMVPLAWAETLAEQLEAADGQPFEFHTYPGDNHNISANFGVAMQRTVAFFDRYVKDRDDTQ